MQLSLHTSNYIPEGERERERERVAISVPGKTSNYILQGLLMPWERERERERERDYYKTHYTKLLQEIMTRKKVT